MPETTNGIGVFEPVHEAHSIEQTAFVLKTSQPLSDAAFSQVRDAAKQFSEELPGFEETQSISFAIAAGAQLPIPIPPGSGGVVLHKARPDSTIEDELRLDRSSIVFKTTAYTRWEAVWSKARKYFEVVAPIYAKHAKIEGLSLNVLDKFVCTSSTNECKPEQILRSGSAYLCPHIFKTSDFWHSHTGAFVRVDNTIKRLFNVNADYLEERLKGETRRIIAITTVLTDMFNQPNYESLNLEGQNIVGFIDTRMNNLHVAGKSMFSEIINEATCKRVALIG